jgi:uncharacterized protein with NAD-binding domain and iron-sulfur cluster
VCSELTARNSQWRDMVEHVATVQTQAFQLWLNEDVNALGWQNPRLSSLSAFAYPFGTWADMTHLVPREDWPEPAPRSIAYFCGVLGSKNGRDAGAPRERVRRAAVEFLNHEIGSLWPRAVRTSGGFRWELLVDPQAGDGTRRKRRAGEARFDSQFWTANVNPSDRYVQSLAGTSAYRISPLERHFDNLTIAGDWTACGLEIGCVEAAFVSGRLAAHALSQRPALEDIIGFDHP